MIALLAGLVLSGPPFPFLLGAEWNPDASAAVQSLFLETGCNFVRLTGGGYGWAAPKHVASLKFLQPHGIKALVQLGSHWPDGKYEEHTADYFVDDQGMTGKKEGYAVTYSGQSWPQMTYASDGYRKGLEADFAAYLDQVKPYDNVMGLLLHNEPGYFWVDGRVFDYNPQSIAKFRQWLPSQYSAVADLNQHWGSSFASFAVVDPPRERPPVSHIGAWMDWRRFNAWMIQDFLKWESSFAKTQMPSTPNMTNLSGPLDNWYPLRLGDNYKFASASNAACIDIYPGEWTNRYFAGLSVDMERGVAQGRPVIVAECESYDSVGFPKLSEEQRAQRLKNDLWTYIGHGARGICIWSLSGQQGFVLTHGEFNARMGVLRETAHLAGMIGLDSFYRPKAPVALCVDQDAFLYFGGLNPNRDGGQVIQKSVNGLYAALVQSGHDVDIICADDIRAGKAAGYKAVVMATPAITDEALARQLSAYVKGGGCLVAEAPFAIWDRWGQLADRSALGLDALFGVSTKPLAADLVGGPKFDWTSHTPIELKGATAAGTGRLSATLHPFGNGKAVLFDSSVGITNGEGENADARAALGQVLSGLAPRAISVTGPGFVDSSYLQDGQGNTLVVLTNPSDKKEPILVKKGVEVSLQPSVLRKGSQVFRLGASGASGASAVEEVTGPLQIGKLDAAAVFLVASDHLPLLSLRAPSSVKAKQGFSVQVKVWNPSPRVVDGTVSLKVPEGWQVEGKAVRVASRGSAVVSVRVVAGVASARAVLVPVFLGVKGVPVDVVVE